MNHYLGIDTSNYTTSVSIIDDTGSYRSSRRILSVKEGELGLRQSDAVFAHVKQFSEVFSELDIDPSSVRAIGVSSRPRSVDGSYMPCFMYGVSVARSFAHLLGVPCLEFSHQQGHIAAGLLSSGRCDLADAEFYAFHASGGTTEFVHVDGINNISIIGRTLDISFGKIIDRTGTALGLKFPCGAELEKLASGGKCPERIKVSLKGIDCAVSGVENKVNKLIEDGVEPKDIAFYVLTYVAEACYQMVHEYGDPEMPVLFVGGVMSNTYIREYISKKLENDSIFAKKDLSSDNAVGIAWLTSRYL